MKSELKNVPEPPPRQPPPYEEELREMHFTLSRSRRGGSTGARRWARKTETPSLINPLSFVEYRDDDHRDQIELRRWMKVEVRTLENEELAS